MKVLIVGGGGREHALAWKAAQSETVTSVFVAPGNAGTALEQGVENIEIGPMEIDALLDFAQQERVDLTIIGPEAPLVAGITDRFNKAGLACFGPSKAAARLEGSKSFAKEFMVRHKIPTASYASFTDINEAISYLEKIDFPSVIKADGLAAGKGVVIAENHDQAIETLKDMLSGNSFGNAGSRVVIEQFLKGEEASFICMVDGKNALPMASSQDHKAAYDDDKGPNTGGMGAYSPSPLIDKIMHDRIMKTVIEPTVSGMAKEGTPYTGFLYAGLMIDEDQIPKVVEFNCRFGDPEAQPVLTRLKSDLIKLCLAGVRGSLSAETVEWDPRSCLGVVMAAEGYPGSYSRGDEIKGLEWDLPETRAFHAGTKLDTGRVCTDGGRVLCVTACGESVSEAKDRAYDRVRTIEWKGAWYRNDIGYRAVNRETDASTQDC